MKNKLFFVCAMLVAQQASAMMMEPRTSIYAGAQLGYSQMASKLHSELMVRNALNPENFDTASSDVSDISNGSFAGGGHIGMGYRFPNCFYLGGEFRYNAFSAKAQKQTNTTLGAESATVLNKLNLKNLADLNLLIGGYICENTLVYARLGGCFAAQQTLATTGSFGEATNKKNLGGFSAGLGVKINCGSRVYLGFDYTINSLGKVSQKAVNDENVLTHQNTLKNQYCHLALFSVGIRLFGW
jgi:opacity protein-like surface antigen